MRIPTWLAWAIAASAVGLATAQFIWFNDSQLVSVISATLAALVVGFVLGGGKPITDDDSEPHGEHERIELPAPGTPDNTTTMITPAAALHPGTPGDTAPKKS